MHRRQTVDHQGADGRGIDRGEQEILADEPPAQHEQRHVEDDDDGADGQARQQVVDDLPQTGEAAHADVVWVKHPVEPHGIQGAGRRDDEILRQDVPFHRLLLFSYNRVSCSSPRSSGRSRAPVPGMLRVALGSSRDVWKISALGSVDSSASSRSSASGRMATSLLLSE